MSNNSKSVNNYGPVFSCGAASVSFSHKDGEPTIFDRLIAAVKGRRADENRCASKTDSTGVAVSYGAAQ